MPWLLKIAWIKDLPIWLTVTLLLGDSAYAVFVLRRSAQMLELVWVSYAYKNDRISRREKEDQNGIQVSSITVIIHL